MSANMFKAAALVSILVIPLLMAGGCIDAASMEDASFDTDQGWKYDDFEAKEVETMEDDVYLFEDGSSDESRFLEEVVMKGLTEFDPEEYGVITGNAGADDYVLYSLKSEALCKAEMDERGLITYRFSMAPVRVVSDTYFVESEKTLRIIVSYDDNRYSALMHINGQDEILDSGKEYSFKSEYNQSAFVYMKVLDERDDSFVAEGKILVSGNVPEGGSMTTVGYAMLAVFVLIAVAVLLMRIRPKWSR